MKMNKSFLIILFAVAVVSCSSEQEVRMYSVSYSFSDSTSGWTGGFADYPTDSTGYHLQFELDTLPYKINADSSKKALRISGINGNNDLFMFLKKKVTGLRKNTTYQLLFNVRFASNAPTGEAGESVYVKAGGSTEEPEAEIVEGHYRINLDKGNQAEGGEDMIVIGHVGVAGTTSDYTIITRNNNTSNASLVTTDNQGEAWIIIGTDSGYPGKTTLYYTQIDAFFNQVD